MRRARTRPSARASARTPSRRRAGSTATTRPTRARCGTRWPRSTAATTCSTSSATPGSGRRRRRWPAGTTRCSSELVSARPAARPQHGVAVDAGAQLGVAGGRLQRGGAAGADLPAPGAAGRARGAADVAGQVVPAVALFARADDQGAREEVARLGGGQREIGAGVAAGVEAARLDAHLVQRGGDGRRRGGATRERE